MKQNIKRFMLWLCMALSLLFLTACSKSEQAEETVDLNPQIVQDICEFSENMLETISDMSREEAQEQEAEALKEKNTALANGITSWLNIMDDMGALEKIISSKVTAGEDDHWICTVNAQYKKRNLEYKLYFAENESYYVPQSMSFAPEYTIKENMVKAALNTALGMGTVFLVLIFLSFLISCFRFINAAEQKVKARNAVSKPETPSPAVQVQPEAEQEELVDDLELVAVITAAVAAASASSADGLIVRSIKRAPAAKWKRA